MDRCVPRFRRLFDDLGIPATFFVVGSDIDGDAFANRDAVTALANAGHEIASHSHSHPYDLAKWSRRAIDDELGRAHEVLSEAAGRAVVGFRSPGYDLSPALYQALAERGYRYGSSVFGAVPYYAAKAAVMAAMKLKGEASGAVLTEPRCLLAPTDPYHPDPDAPWRRGRGTTLEIPIAVTPALRLPVIGTTLVLAPDVVGRGLLRAVRRRPLLNLEFHGIDLADADTDGFPAALVHVQPDLRIPLAVKTRRIRTALASLADRFEFATLADASSAFM